MLIEKQIIEKIFDILAILEVSVKNKGSIHFHDDKTACETFFTGLFNIIYKLKLENANNIAVNFPAVDLVDNDNALTYQITFENTLSKIRETKKKYISHGIDKKYPNLIIFIYADKPKSRDDDICVNYKNDLLLDIQKLGIEDKKDVLHFLEQNINLYREEKKALELQTVEAVITYLSKQSISDSDADIFENKPFPQKKLELRFKEYYQVITEEYAELYSGYSSVLEQAKSNYVDDGNSGKIKQFLRRKSRDYLLDQENDARAALDELINYLKQEIDEDVYEGALRFYILTELMECDIFPLYKSEKEKLGL